MGDDIPLQFILQGTGGGVKVHKELSVKECTWKRGVAGRSRERKRNGEVVTFSAGEGGRDP